MSKKQEISAAPTYETPEAFKSRCRAENMNTYQREMAARAFVTNHPTVKEAYARRDELTRKLGAMDSNVDAAALVNKLEALQAQRGELALDCKPIDKVSAEIHAVRDGIEALSESRKALEKRIGFAVRDVTRAEETVWMELTR